MKTSSLILSILLIIGLMLTAGCGESPTAPVKEEITWGNPSSQLHGLWLFTSAQVDGSSSTLAYALDWVSGSAYAAIQIESDGTLNYAEFDQNFEITISGEGRIYTANEPHTSKFKFNLTNDLGESFNVSGTWSVSGAVLTLVGTVDDESLKLTCEKI